MKYLNLLVIVLSISIVGCSDDPDIGTLDDNDIPNNVNVDLTSDNGITEIAALPNDVNFPADNPYSEAKQELGRLLFWDPILSGSMDVACATCHHPDFGYADGLARSRGVGAQGIGNVRRGGTLIDRNAPTIINTGFNGIEMSTAYDPLDAPMFWDSRTISLEDQAIEPILSAVEMRGPDIAEDEILDLVVQRLINIQDYRDLFQLAFGSNTITVERVAQALSTFQRGVVSNNSRFDQYMRGNENILSRQELNGLISFIEVGCADCHSGAMFSDFELHTLSVPNNRINDAGINGDYAFRTPSLRNVELTAPYMHNGEFRTLNDVLGFYDDISRRNGNSQNPNVNNNQIADDARNLDLNNNEINNIVAFLRTLTDENFDDLIPSDVPSNLTIGGNIN